MGRIHIAANLAGWHCVGVQEIAKQFMVQFDADGSGTLDVAEIHHLLVGNSMSPTMKAALQRIERCPCHVVTAPDRWHRWLRTLPICFAIVKDGLSPEQMIEKFGLPL